MEVRDLLFVVSDGELEMTRYDTSFLIITSSVTSQFEDFCGEIFKDGSEVD